LVKCKYCGEQAYVWVSRAGGPLCRKHLIQLVEKGVEKTVRKFRMLEGVRKLGVAVSGGKDSVALLHIIHRLYGDKVRLLGITVDLGIDGLRKQFEIAVDNYRELGVPYRLVDLGVEYGFTMDQVARLSRRLRRPVCSICGVVKRYVINKVAYEEGLDAVATGHNLDDMWEFALRTLSSDRIEDFARLSLVSPRGPRMIPRIKPLGLTEEWLIEEYAKARGLRFFEGSCPYKPKNDLREALRYAASTIDEAAPGYLKMSVKGFLEAAGRIKPPEVKLRFCERCGMPTTRRICSFCSIREKILGLLAEENSIK